MNLQWQKSVDQQLRELHQKTADLPVRVKPGGGGSGGLPSGSSQAVWYTAETKAELPDASTVEETALGRVTAGDDQGMVCVVNPAKDGWDAINFFE